MSEKTAILHEQDAPTPAASLGCSQACRSWFCYNHEIYSVERCTQELFTAFIASVLQRMEGQSRHPIDLTIGSYPHESMLERWYVLQILLETKGVCVHLFASREEAQKSFALARVKK